MNNVYKQLTKLAAIAIATSMLAIAAIAAPTEKEYLSSYNGRTDIPVPMKVATPKIPAQYGGETIRVSFIVDESGKVNTVKLLTAVDSKTEMEISKALAQWEFKPFVKNGTPSIVPVQLPILVASN